MQGLDFELIAYTHCQSMDGFIYDLQVKIRLLSTFTYSLLIHGGLGFIITKHEVGQCDLGHEFLGPKYKSHLPS
jgi:hypothetical protein